MASAACASISNQMRKRVSGAQIWAISGPGVAGDHGRLLDVRGQSRGLAEALKRFNWRFRARCAI